MLGNSPNVDIAMLKYISLITIFGSTSFLHQRAVYKKNYVDSRIRVLSKYFMYLYTLARGHKLNVNKTFTRPPGPYMKVLCTFNLCTVSRRYQFISFQFWLL